MPVTVGSGVGVRGGGAGGWGVGDGRSERPLHIREQARTAGGRGSVPTHLGRDRLKT